MGFLHHAKEQIGAVVEDVAVDQKPDIALTFVESTMRRGIGEGGGKDMAKAEKVIKPGAALGEGHRSTNEAFPLGLELLCRFLHAADVFA